MSQYRKNDPIEDFRRSNKTAKSRQTKHRFHTARKQVFLTDTQTSDYTKSSGQMRGMKIDQLQIALRDLQRQNQQLKHTIVSLKSTQYFQFNQQKLKDLIRDNQKLKQQTNLYKNQLQQVLIQRDFLLRFNKNLKNQCQSLMKQILSLRTPHSIYESKKLQKSQLVISNEQVEQIQKSYRRSASTEVLLVKSKKQKQKQKPKQFKQLQKLKKSRDNITNNASQKYNGKLTQNPYNSDYFNGSANMHVSSRSKLVRFT